MVGWYNGLNEHGFEQILGDSEEQGSLVCCNLWGCKESDVTEQLKNHDKEKLPGPEYAFLLGENSLL